MTYCYIHISDNLSILIREISLLSRWQLTQRQVWSTCREEESVDCSILNRIDITVLPPRLWCISSWMAGAETLEEQEVVDDIKEAHNSSRHNSQSWYTWTHQMWQHTLFLYCISVAFFMLVAFYMLFICIFFLTFI